MNVLPVLEPLGLTLEVCYHSAASTPPAAAGAHLPPLIDFNSTLTVLVITYGASIKHADLTVDPIDYGLFH